MSRYLGFDCHYRLPVFLGQHSTPFRFALSSERKRRVCHHVSADLSRRDMHACGNKRIGRAYISGRRACTYKSISSIEHVNDEH